MPIKFFLLFSICYMYADCEPTPPLQSIVKKSDIQPTPTPVRGGLLDRAQPPERNLGSSPSASRRSGKGRCEPRAASTSARASAVRPSAAYTNARW